MDYKAEKQQIIYWAKKMNEKGFVTARSGNLSLKTQAGILITVHDSYLGELKEEDIVLIDAQGKTLAGQKEPTSEKALHLAVHNKLEPQVVLHSHSPHTVAFFHYFGSLDIFSFEARFYLGNVPVIAQDTPTVTNPDAVVKALENNSVAVLQNHGVVAIGESFAATFSLIELLEEQCRINLMLKGIGQKEETKTQAFDVSAKAKEKYRLLSPQHIEKLVQLVNNDAKAQSLGQKYDLTCSLAVKNQDTGQAVCFYYEKGKIVKTDQSDTAEFVIIGPEEILKKVFNRQMDAFVASTQGKVKTKGDFAKMSRWYPVLVRTFELWKEAPVE